MPDATKPATQAAAHKAIAALTFVFHTEQCPYSGKGRFFAARTW
jgi:hypothetical protein